MIGVGASELIYYPYWCLEKGYARHIGTDDGTAGWATRARGWMRVMRIDAGVSLVLYTAITVAFYLLGAAVLHARGLDVTNADMIHVLSQMFRQTFGEWTLVIFLTGAFFVLYSTYFGATAANARLAADALVLFGVTHYRDEAARLRAVRWFSIGISLSVRAGVSRLVAAGDAGVDWRHRAGADAAVSRRGRCPLQPRHRPASARTAVGIGRPVALGRRHGGYSASINCGRSRVSFSHRDTEHTEARR